ncbi:MAG: UDP-glycosyltransferase [Burkholderiales bacterium]|nr:UDP-glycosyltransferase [Flavobacterium sp.]
MKRMKVFILLPDGIGLRNFAYTDFYKTAQAHGFDIVFWNNTPFDLTTLGFDEIRIENAKCHPITNILKKARVQIDLNLNKRRFNDSVYDSYRFPVKYDSIKATLKILALKVVVLFYSSEQGIEKVKKRICNLEKKTGYYQYCLEVLATEKPDFVFSTNQRTVAAIAPILAAQALKIPTATFIFSWDNLPKATLVLEPDYYFVWSTHMKAELRLYYPFIAESQIFVTGTPQFESHSNRRHIQSKEVFFKKYHLDVARKYICYSGDDITTSPNDPQYLEDTIEAIRKLNAKGYQLGIIFRRCPVDFSDRYDAVLDNNKDIVTSIDPKWQKTGVLWNTILPTVEDLDLQMNTIAHSEMVINLGSSMVFDYIAYEKPCAYINYDIIGATKSHLSIKQIYEFVHFRSMPSPESVLWINSSNDIEQTIINGLEHKDKTIKSAEVWFEKINQHPVNQASSRIVQAIQEIMSLSEF